MGIMIYRSNFAIGQKLYRLTIDCTNNESDQAISIGRLLAAELINVRPQMRSIQLEKCLVRVLGTLPIDSVIKDIDVMFNPTYAVDVLQVLVNAYKQKQYSLIWPGTYKDGNLIYAEEGCSDYKAYYISDYDIICLI